MRRNRRRGVVVLLAVVLVCGATMLGLATYVATVAVAAGRVQHQRDTVQCVYAAESGIDLARARINSGEIPREPLVGSVGNGFFTTEVRQADGVLIITSDGLVERPGRANLVRRIEGRCALRGGRYVLMNWESLPPPETVAGEPPEPAGSEPESLGDREESR
jgi:hypothetical protein